jgi:hypothetical protein
MNRILFLLLSLSLLLGVACTRGNDRWTAMLYADATGALFTEVGDYPTLEACVEAGREKKRERDFLECGKNCEWTQQGLYVCEETYFHEHRDQ